MFVLLAVLACLVKFQSVNSEFELIIFHSGNIEGKLLPIDSEDKTCARPNVSSQNLANCAGGLSRAMQMISQERGKDSTHPNRKTMFLFSGNIFRGSIMYRIGGEKVCGEFLNIMKPDAVTLGYYEFSEGIQKVYRYLNELHMPVVSTNLDMDLPAALKNGYVKSTVIEANGTRIGIVGYMALSPTGGGLPRQALLEEALPILQDACTDLAGQGVQIIIAIGSADFETDKAIAMGIPEVHAVVGSSNILLSNKRPPFGKSKGPYPYMVKQSSGRCVPVLELPRRGRYLGHVKLTFNDVWIMTKAVGEPIYLSHYIPDHPSTAAVVQKWLPKFRSTFTQSIGSSPVLMEADNNVCCLKECNLGNMVTDALLQYALQRTPEPKGWSDISGAVMPCNMLTSSIKPVNTQGNITLGHVLHFSDYNAEIYRCAIDGLHLKNVLESAIMDPQNRHKRGHFLQISGMRVVYDTSKPVYKRVVSVEVLCTACTVPKYQPLDKLTVYQILAPADIVNNNPFFHSFQVCGPSAKFVGMHSDMVVEYLKRYSPIFPEEDERIVFTNVTKKKNGNKAWKGFQKSKNTYAYIVTILINLFWRYADCY